MEPALAPVLSMGVLGLTSDEASGFAGYYGESDLVYLLSFHSLVVGKVAVLLVAVIKVATVLEDMVGQDAWTRRSLGREAFTGMSDRIDCW